MVCSSLWARLWMSLMILSGGILVVFVDSHLSGMTTSSDVKHVLQMLTTLPSSQCFLAYHKMAVAEYLKRQISPISDDPTEDLSLNKILEGKTRRISARMFCSILV
ncbi:hypothetical protein PIB30_097315, partial [Stylosanthes scabra]|nr:hypothetical protein [Stylosanthes scabra]